MKHLNAPKFLRGGHSPEEEQVRVAKKIVVQLDPKSFADAMNNAIPRDVENLARSFGVIHEVEPDFMLRIAELISEDEFFAATTDDWRMQSQELNHLIRHFCIGGEFEPARSWIQKNQHHITGALATLFVAIAPDVAIEFYNTGESVEIVNPQSPRWAETNLAIRRIAKRDQLICVEIVEQHLNELEEASYCLNLDPTRWIFSFFRILHELSVDLFDRFVEKLDLDNPIATETISRLAKSQHKERTEYQKLARLGKRFDGKIGELATSFLERLESMDAS